MGRSSKSSRSRRRRKLPLPILLGGAVVLAVLVMALRPTHNTANAELSGQTTESSPYGNPHKRELQTSFLTTFDNGHDPKHWYVSDFTIRNSGFRNSWSRDNVTFGPDGVALALREERDGEMPFSGAEYQRTGWMQYGRFETIMKPATGSGAATGFFTHTNSYFDDPHDEIDIEWLGNQPHLVQLNVYRDGKAQGAWRFNMPYDVAEDFHLYAFEWTPTDIRWFVDGKELMHITDQDIDIPDSPQRLIYHLWTGHYFQWHGQPTFASGTSAQLRCVSYTRLDAIDAGQCADFWKDGKFVPPVPKAETAASSPAPGRKG